MLAGPNVTKLHIDHIHPAAGNAFTLDGVSHWEEPELRMWMHHIGNLCLLSREANIDAGELPMIGGKFDKLQAIRRDLPTTTAWLLDFCEGAGREGPGGTPLFDVRTMLTRVGLSQDVHEHSIAGTVHTLFTLSGVDAAPPDVQQGFLGTCKQWIQKHTDSKISSTVEHNVRILEAVSGQTRSQPHGQGARGGRV